MDIKTKENEFILQPNHLSRGCYSISVTAKRLFSMAIAVFNEKADITQENNLTVIFSIRDYFKAYGLESAKSGTNQKTLITAAGKELRTAGIDVLDINLNGDFEYYGYNFFQKINFSWGWDKLEFKFTQDIARVLVEYKKSGYSKIDLLKLGNLQSIYSIRIYEISMSFSGFAGIDGNKKGCWWFEYSIDELRLILKTEDKYKANKEFKRKCVDIPIQEINQSNIGLYIEIEYIRKGKNLIGFKFNCEYCNSIGIKENPATELDEECNYYHNKYTREFEELVEDYRKKNHTFGFESAFILKACENNYATEELKKRYPRSNTRNLK